MPAPTPGGGRAAAPDHPPPLALEQVAHELRTPLAAIRSAAEILADHPELPADARARFTRVVLDEGRRLHARIERLIEAGLRSGLIR